MKHLASEKSNVRVNHLGVSFIQEVFARRLPGARDYSRCNKNVGHSPHPEVMSSWLLNSCSPAASEAAIAALQARSQHRQGNRDSARLSRLPKVTKPINVWDPNPVLPSSARGPHWLH